MFGKRRKPEQVDSYFKPSPAKPPTASQSLPSRPPTEEELARHSVYNELDIFPKLHETPIDRDWSCSNCGYNLRGLMTGAKCPECGQIELSRPPPEGALSYATWFENQKRKTSTKLTIFVTLGTILIAGPFAVLGTFATMMPTPLGPILIGPTIEEIMKISLLALIVERRPWLFRREFDIRLAAVCGALGFAAIENVLYLNVYISSPSFGLILWRWIVCTTLHVICTSVAVGGIVSVWERTDREGREPSTKLMFAPLTTAIVLHAAYNATVTIMDVAGFVF